MRTSVAAVFLVPLAMSGCSSLPRSFHQQAATATQIVQSVQCELASVYNSVPAADTLIGWYVRVKLVLTGTNTIGLSPTVTPTAALKLPEGITATPVTGHIDTNDTRKATVQFDAALADYSPLTPTGAALAARCPTPGSSAAARGMGLSEWMISTLGMVGSTVGRLSDLGYQVDFTVNRNASGGLTFKTEMFELKLDKATSTGGLNDVNSLLVTFLRDKKATVFGTAGRGSDIPDDVTRDLDFKIEDLEEKPVIQLVPGDTLVVQ